MCFVQMTILPKIIGYKYEYKGFHVRIGGFVASRTPNLGTGGLVGGSKWSVTREKMLWMKPSMGAAVTSTNAARLRFFE